MSVKRATALILSVIFTALLSTACVGGYEFTQDDDLTGKLARNTNIEDTFNYEDGAADAPTSYATYSDQVTEFELRMFRNYHKQMANTSYVFSPAVSVLQLGLIANGASDDTVNEIINAIGRGTNVDSFNKCTSYFKSRLEAVANAETTADGDKDNDKSKSYVSFNANMLVNDNTDVKNKFLQTDKDYFGIPVYRFMFGESNMLTKANSLFTDWGINALSKLDNDQSVVTASSADICDVWLDSYAKTDIEQGVFNSDNKKSNVTYMSSAETYMKTDKAQAVMKYTLKTPLKLMAVLPNEDVSIDDYISDFSNLELSNLLNSVDFTKKAAVKLPQFTINTQSSAVNMKSVLEESGLYSLFTDKAKFGNFTYNDKINLNAMYEVTPSISINAGGIGGTKTNSSNPALINHNTTEKTDVKVEFNRPFIFLILDNESNIPIYIGTVVDF